MIFSTVFPLHSQFLRPPYVEGEKELCWGVILLSQTVDCNGVEPTNKITRIKPQTTVISAHNTQNKVRWRNSFLFSNNPVHFENKQRTTFK